MTTAHLPYYADKASTLAKLLGANRVDIEHESLVVNGHRFPIVDDVIVLLSPDRYPRRVIDAIGRSPGPSAATAGLFAPDIQSTFGEEWRAYPEVLREHEQEFRNYFDLVDVESLGNATICDLGCGSGRWSYFLRGRCRQLILVDFSEAIFVARRNLADSTNALFFMADLTDLPFRRPFADLIICLGVLHHLPIPALEAVRSLRGAAPRVLVYLYYAVDNRPAFFRVLLAMVSGLRRLTSRVRNSTMRDALSWALTLGVYVPLVGLGNLLSPIGLARFVPLHDTYKAKGVRRIRQDVYDRFFTRIEQRFTRESIIGLHDTFASVTVSEELPYWHFLCESAPGHRPLDRLPDSEKPLVE